MISLFLLSLFIFIQFPPTDQFYQTAEQECEIWKEEREIWKKECKDVCKTGWIKVCEMTCEKKKAEKKCPFWKQYACSVSGRKGKACCQPTEEDKDICEKECFYNWHKKPHLNLLSKTTSKMDKGKALHTLKSGMHSLVKLGDANKDGNVTRHEIDHIISLVENNSTHGTKHQKAMLGAVESALGSIKAALDSLGLPEEENKTKPKLHPKKTKEEIKLSAKE